MSIVSTSSSLPSLRLKVAAITLLLMAATPTFLWYINRSKDKSDEPLGLLALSALIFFLISKRFSLKWQPATILIGSIALLPLQLAGPNVPPMLIAAFLWLVIFCSLEVPGKAGIGLLMLLSLPVMASLDFYAGYPMRWTASWMADNLLTLGGIAVERQGLVLLNEGNAVGVDPPCSGIRMLWASLFVAALVSIRSRLSLVKTILLLLVTIFMVVLGNSLRATILFLPESGLVHWPHWTHEGVGLVIYALLLMLIFTASNKLATQSTKPPAIISFRVTSALLSTIAILLLILSHKKDSEIESTNEAANLIEIPKTWQGQPLRPMPLSEQERNFLQSFPGQIAKYHTQDSEIIFRLVSKPTRLLHSSTDCFKASGFSIESQPVFYDDNRQLWSCSIARLNGRTYRLKERIISAEDGKAYQDVSAWYWAGLWKKDSGPWLAITVLEPLKMNTEM